MSGVFTDSFANELADKVAARVIAAIAKNGRPSDRRLYTMKEAAKYLALSLSTLKLMVAAGELVVVSRGGRRMIDQADLDVWIARHKT